MAKLFANSGDPDQMLHTVASDLGLHCFPVSFLWGSRLRLNIDTVIREKKSKWFPESCWMIVFSVELIRKVVTTCWDIKFIYTLNEIH